MALLLVVLVMMTIMSSTNAQWTTSEILADINKNDASASSSSIAMFVALPGGSHCLGLLNHM